MTAQVADRGQQRRVIELCDEVAQRFRAVGGAGQALAQLVSRAAQQPLVLGIRHREDPLPQEVAAGTREEVLQQATEPDGENLPAGSLEHRLDAACGDVRHHPVQ